VVAVKVHAELFAAALSKRAIMEAWEGGKDGDLQTYSRGDKRLPEPLVEGIVGSCGPDDDDPFIVLTETKFSIRYIPVWARYSPLRTRVEAHAITLSP
jgi:hypothetical protein